MNDLERDLRQMYARREADMREPRFAPTHAPAPLLRRTRHRQVGVAITALAVVAVVAVGSIAGGVALLRSSDRRTPADRSEGPTPTPTRGAPARPADLDQRLTVATAWGEVDGVGWTVWANDDLSCLAFTSVDGDYSGQDGGCENGYDGSDLTWAGTCVYACPVPRHPIVYGTVSARVAAVRFANDDGTALEGTIHAVPLGAVVDARVFTVSMPSVRSTGWLTAIGADGTVVSRLRYPPGADEPGGPSTPVVVEATLASGVPTSAVDGRASEADRWEIAIWRAASGDLCLGTIFPDDGRATVATETGGCGPRGDLFDGIRSGAVGHADVWWIDEASMFGENARWFRYRAVGTVSRHVASVRIELADGQVIDAELVDPPAGFEGMGRLFIAEFRSKDHPWEYGGEGGISWRAIALNANGEILGSDEIGL